jgi:DNA-binding Lrp family transcriptional regulator
MPGLFQMILTQVCYRSIAPAIGLTMKSVKTRVDNMISGNVIERFVTLVNRHSSAIIGYVLLQLERMS